MIDPRFLSAGVILLIALAELGGTLGLSRSVLLPAEAGLLLSFLPLSLLRASPLARLLGGGSLVAAILLLPRPLPLWSALEEAGPFAAFLASLQLLRAAAGTSRAVAEVRRRLSLLPEATHLALMEVGGVILGAVVANGAHPILAACVEQDHDHDGAHRRRQALAALRGICLASAWSPFFLALPFIASRMPGVSYAALAGGGLIFSAAALAADLGLASIGLGEILAILHTLAPLAAGVGLLVAAVAALVMGGGLAPLAATGLAILGMVLLQQAIERRPDGARDLLKRAWTGLGSVNDEMLVLVSALLLARAAGSHGEWIGALAPAVAGLPAAAQLSAVAALLVGGALVGLHPTFTASLVIALGPLMTGIRSETLAATLLISWGLATMVSPASLTVMLASQMFGVSTRSLVLSDNLPRVAIGGAAMVAFLAFC